MIKTRIGAFSAGSALLMLAALALAPLAAADCPDIVSCQIKVWLGRSSTHQEVGKIHVPTCYKFGKGCRPWHCDGQWEHTNRDYWTDQCVKRVPSCKPSEECAAKFPGAPNR
jgi:hypothetical protein